MTQISKNISGIKIDIFIYLELILLRDCPFSRN
jgi:hypothetical protein